MNVQALLNSTLLLVATALTVPAAADTEPQAVRDQFVIALPDGWSVYDQNEAVFGKPGPVGMVLFSAQPLAKAGASADAKLLAQVDTGELASFFVDRMPADRGMSCDKLSKSAIYNIGTKLNQDPLVSTGSRRFFGGAIAPGHEDIELGGCHGVKFVIEAHKGDAAKHAIVDVRAVSDGKVLYLFALRNKADHYARNIDAFESALTSLHFKLAP